MNDIDLLSPVNWEDPLTHGLILWHVNLPGRYGGTRAYDLVSGHLLTRTGMASPPTSTSGPGTTTRPGAWGEERFDGTDDSLVVSTAVPITTSMTVVIKFRRSAGTANQVLANSPNYYTGGFNGNWLFRISGDTALAFASYDGQGNESYQEFSVPSIGTTVWHQAAVSLNGVVATVFLDGRASSSGTLAHTKALVDTQLGLRIGTGIGNNAFLAGQLDDVAVYDRALSQHALQSIAVDSSTSHPRMLRRVEGPWSGGTSGALTQSLGGTLASSGGLPRTITKALAGAV